MTADTVGGVWSYALELARALRPEIATTLATMGAPPTAAQRAEAAAVPDLELRESDYRLEWMEEPWRDVAAAGRWLLELERAVRPDVVHLNGYAHAALAFRAPTVVVGHSCVGSWWRAVHGADPPSTWDHYREAVAAGLRAAGAVVAPTATMLAGLRAYGPLGRLLPPRVVANGRDPARFPPREKAAYVCAAGRVWDPAKNLLALARAAARCAWPVIVAGDAAPPAGAAGSGPPATPGGLQLVGRLAADQLAELLGGAAVFAHPARYEPFGLAPLEAALAGCALVLGDIPSLREVWGDAADYAPPDDDATLGERLAALAGDPARRAARAAAARARALQLSPGRLGAAMREVYARLAEAA